MRRKQDSSSEEEPEVKKDEEECDQESVSESTINTWDKLQEIKMIHSLKKKINRGLNTQNLWIADNKDPSMAKDDSQRKGLVNELDLGNTFSVETNRRDEDADMLKYIEEQLAMKKGIVNESYKKDKNFQMDPDEILFNILPKHLLKTDDKKSEEMLSNQMLSGIPEVDLGIDEKIRNIEATEEAKMKLMEKRKRKTNRVYNTLVSSNVASNNTHQNHHNDDNHQVFDFPKKPKVSKPTVTLIEEPVVVIGHEPKQGYFRANTTNQSHKLKFPGKEKASDDYHFEKFKKHFKK